MIGFQRTTNLQILLDQKKRCSRRNFSLSVICLFLAEELGVPQDAECSEPSSTAVTLTQLILFENVLTVSWNVRPRSQPRRPLPGRDRKFIFYTENCRLF